MGPKLRRWAGASGAVGATSGFYKEGMEGGGEEDPASFPGIFPPLPRYPSVACEILTSDVPQINDALGADESLLNRLYGFLQSSGSLNPLLASFFSKVMGILINRKTDQVPLPTWGEGGEAGGRAGGHRPWSCHVTCAVPPVPSLCPSCGRRMTSLTCCYSTLAPQPSWTSCCVSSPAWSGHS